MVTPCRNGASSTTIGVPKTVSPAGIRWIAWPHVAKPLMKLVETTKRSGSPPPVRGLERVADQVGRPVGARIRRRGRVIGREDVEQAVHLRRGTGRVVRSLGDAVIAAILDVVDHVLELNGHVEVERRLNTARHDLGSGGLSRSADLDGELERLAILRPACADGGQTGLIDLGAGPAIADKVHGRPVCDRRQGRRAGGAAQLR